MAKKVIKSWPNLLKAREALPKEKNPIYVDSFSYPVLLENLSGEYFHIYTYGCQANIRDEETIKGVLSQFGMRETSDIKEARIIILNTCAVRENAENKVFAQIGELKALKNIQKKLLIGICGCMIQQPDILKVVVEKHPHVDFAFGTDQISELPDILNEVIVEGRGVINVRSGAGRIVENLPSVRNNDKQGFVNIMFGCDKFCTYCIVPFTRGRQRSRLKVDILKEVLEMKQNGYVEVTLLGQNVNAYGKDLDNGDTFASLLGDVARIGIPRVRFLTSHPWDFSDELIKVIKENDNIVRFLHLPIQSGSSKLLREMGRRYTADDYRKIYYALKKEIPDMAFSTDIIVGYPTETYEDFQETLKIVDELEYTQYFTFIFSPRLGTFAATLNPVVTLKDHKKWFKELTDLCAKKLELQNQGYIGKTIDVLVLGISKKNSKMMTGYTPDNKTIHFPGDSSMIDSMVRVRVLETKTFSIFGEIVYE